MPIDAEPPMTRTLVALAIALPLLLVAGCGQKGPLYLPDEPAETTAESQQPEE
jgi:predicted small lipoprotein YifL